MDYSYILSHLDINNTNTYIFLLLHLLIYTNCLNLLPSSTSLLHDYWWDSKQILLFFATPLVFATYSKQILWSQVSYTKPNVYCFCVIIHSHHELLILVGSVTPPILVKSQSLLSWNFPSDISPSFRKHVYQLWSLTSMVVQVEPIAETCGHVAHILLYLTIFSITSSLPYMQPKKKNIYGCPSNTLL